MDRLHIFAPPPGAVNPIRRPGNLILPPDQRGFDRRGRGKYSSLRTKRKRSESPVNSINSQLIRKNDENDDTAFGASSSSAGSTSSDRLQPDRPEGRLSGQSSLIHNGTDNFPISASQPTTEEQKVISRAFRHLSPSDQEQYRTSGLDPRLSPPPPPFPAAPVPDISSTHLLPDGGGVDGLDVLTQAKLLLDAHKPTLYHAPGLKYSTMSGQRTRETHLAVMNTVLHRSLLDGEYERAGRAFALMLRANPLGPRMLRRRDVCGVGAEILLRRRWRDRRGEDDDSDDEDDDEEQGRVSSDAEPFISDRSFDLVKDYFERLAVEYPLKVHGRGDKLNFWPSFFKLWIYQALEHSKHARIQALATRDDDSMAVSSSDEEDNEDDRRIRTKELDDARAIAERFDEIVQTAPCDKHPELLRLRGMVSQWIADLLLDSASKSRPSTQVDSARSRELRIAEDMFARAEKESMPK
jgi:RNA polymerase I specific initiation factor